MSEKISSLIINIIEQKYFFEDYQKHSITFIIEKHLEEADNDLNNYNGFLKYSKNIILGTSGGHYTRLIQQLPKIIVLMFGNLIMEGKNVFLMIIIIK